MKLLLIYIPTYNRPKELENQLEVLQKELLLHKDIDLIVNDNCSDSYSFTEIIKKFKIENSVFRQNAVNIGANANIALSYTFWNNQEYLWILSDDDFLQPGVIEKIKKHLHSKPDLLSIIDMPIEEENYIYSWVNGWVVPVSEGIGLISGAIIKRETFIKYSDYAFLFHNTSFPHLAVIWAGIKERMQISIKRVSIKGIIIPNSRISGESGLYSLSFAGFPLITYFLTKKSKLKLINDWIKAHHVNFFRQKGGKFDFVFQNTKNIIKKSSLPNYFKYYFYYLYSKVKSILRKLLKK